MHVEADCLFCKIVAGDMPAYVLHDDARTIAFLNINPVNPGHTVVVPKVHAVNLFDISDDDGAAMMATARKIAAAIRAALDDVTGINLLQSNGAGADQTIYHVHMHVIPRVLHDGLGEALRWRSATVVALKDMHAQLLTALKR